MAFAGQSEFGAAERSRPLPTIPIIRNEQEYQEI